MDRDTTTYKINLASLKRIDEAIYAIMERARHVILYKHDPVTNQWTHEKVEGTLFLAERNAAPRYSMAILNRLDENDVLIPFSAKTMHFSASDSFLTLRVSIAETFGFWFHSFDDLESMKSALDSIKAAVSPVDVDAFSNPPAASSDAKRSTSNEFDSEKPSILQLFRKATLEDPKNDNHGPSSATAAPPTQESATAHIPVVAALIPDTRKRMNVPLSEVPLSVLRKSMSAVMKQNDFIAWYLNHVKSDKSFQAQLYKLYRDQQNH